LNFFFDNCISYRIAHAINALDERNNLVALRDKFPLDIKDPDWIRQLGADDQDGVIVSGDPAITRGKHEREAWLESGLTAFFWEPRWLKIKLWQQPILMLKWWPKIPDQALAVTSGAGFLIPVRGDRFRVVR
jgi:hypothetical protein